jgi:hypothetical protein
MANRKHDMSRTPEYRAFINAKSRCNNPHVPSYPYYGGRGIRFLFDCFEDWCQELGPRPEAGYSVDRIDSDGNYEPANVRWATRSQQQRNRRYCHTTESTPGDGDGERRHQKFLAEIMGW